MQIEILFAVSPRSMCQELTPNARSPVGNAGASECIPIVYFPEQMTAPQASTAAISLVIAAFPG